MFTVNVASMLGRTEAAATKAAKNFMMNEGGQKTLAGRRKEQRRESTEVGFEVRFF